MHYTIGEISKMMSVPPSTLRYYDKEGLLPFVERSSGGIRVFKNEDLEWLYVVDCLKKTGMSIKEIKSFIELVVAGDESIDERLKLFKKRREQVQEQIENLKQTLATLDYKCWYYETAKEVGSTGLPLAMKLEEVPEQYRPIKQMFDDMRNPSES